MSARSFLLRIAIFVATLASSLSAARATILLELAGGYLKDANGDAISPGSGLLLLVASTGDDSFSILTATSNFTVGGLLNEGSDDYVLYSSSISGDGYMNGTTESGEFRQVISLTLTSAIAEGAALQLYWFPTLSTSNTAATVGTAYGIYRSPVSSGSSDADGSDSWYLPADGTSGWNLVFLTSDAGSLLNSTTDIATYTVAAVPEPMTLSLVALGSIAGVLAQRRKGRS